MLCEVLSASGSSNNRRKATVFCRDADLFTQQKRASPRDGLITIQQATQQDHEDGDFSGKKSLMQSIEASSKDVMPVAFEFKCVPYEGLGERAFSLRNSLLTGDEPRFVLRIVQLEAQEEAIASEFRDLLISKFDGESVETFIGNFKA
ncbi:DUF2303 family protein [Salmonella enterica]|nr:DUF2303 family protein [Salmonella enterica]